jgi:hypothetical protein
MPVANLAAHIFDFEVVARLLDPQFSLDSVTDTKRKILVGGPLCLLLLKVNNGDSILAVRVVPCQGLPSQFVTSSFDRE